MASLSIPYSFTNGDTADANQVNANFNAVKSFVEASVVQTDGSTSLAAASVTPAMLQSKPKLIIPHTFVVGGLVSVQVGQADYINPFFVKVPSTQTVKLISARHRINTGTSATVSVQVNGVNATGFASMSVTTADTDTDPADVTLVNNDKISLVVNSVSGVPQNMSVTVFLEYTWVG